MARSTRWCCGVTGHLAMSSPNTCRSTRATGNQQRATSSTVFFEMDEDQPKSHLDHQRLWCPIYSSRVPRLLHEQWHWAVDSSCGSSLVDECRGRGNQNFEECCGTSSSRRTFPHRGPMPLPLLLMAATTPLGLLDTQPSSGSEVALHHKILCCQVLTQRNLLAASYV